MIIVPDLIANTARNDPRNALETLLVVYYARFKNYKACIVVLMRALLGIVLWPNIMPQKRPEIGKRQVWAYRLDEESMEENLWKTHPARARAWSIW